MRVALVVAVVLAAGCASGGSPREPSGGRPPEPRPAPERLYDGEPLSHWVRQLHDLHKPRSDGAVMPVATFRAAALPHLAEALQSDRDHVRANAAHALYDIALRAPRTEGVVPLLLSALEDGFYGVRFWASGALGEMRPTPPEAEPALERLLKDPSPELRETVRKRLEEIRAEARKQADAKKQAELKKPAESR